MENRFLKRLQIGLVDLQKNPLATEVAEITRTDFEVFVRIFRHGLSPEIQKSLPPHNLADKEYLRILAFQVDSFLKKPAPETEKILANMPPIKSLELAFQKAHEGQAVALAQHQAWKATFEQQVKQYNLDLVARLDQQLQKEFPSLAENPGKRKILVSDMAQTIQDQGLKDIKGDYEFQAKNIIEKVVQTTIKHYATEIEELQTEEMASKPQGVEEKIITTSKIIAEEEAKPAFTIRRGQIMAETSPTETPIYKVNAAIRTSIIANLPPELAENEEVVDTILGEIEAQIHQDPQQNITQIVQDVFKHENVQTKIAATKIAFSPTQQQNFIDSVAPEIAPVIHEVAARPDFATGTGFAGSTASFTPGGGGMPPPGASGLYSTSSIPEGSIEDVFFSSGQPLHLFTAIASPHSAIDFGKWLITAGPIRSGIGFILDSAPGMPKMDYFNIGLGLIFQTQRQLKEKIGTLQDQRELTEAKTRLSFINDQVNALQKIPGFEKFYNFYYGGLGRLLHPLQTLQLWAINKNVFAGLAVSNLTNLFSWTVQYNLAGFTYGIEQIPVQFGMLTLKYGLSKTGLYKVVGLPNSRHLVFAPTYELGLKIKRGIYKKILQPIKVNIGLGLRKLGRKLKIPGFVTAGRKIITGALGKIMAALMKFLGFLGMAWGLVKLLWNKVIKPAALFLIYLILTHGVPAIAGMIGGALVGLPFAAKAFALTFGFFSPFISPLLAWIPATVVAITVDLLFALGGAGVGILFENFMGNLGSSFSNMITNFGTLPNFGPVFSGYVGPVLGITGATVIGGTMLTQMITSSAFWIPEQTSQIQSQYIKIVKTPSFSGKIGDTIEYSVTVTSLKNSLTNIKISDNITFHCRENPPSVPAIDFGAMPQEIAAGGSYTFKYEISSYTTSRLNDCLVVNSATVTADVKDGPTGEQGFASASVSIGNPPFEYPSGWPVAAGCITQGPNGNESHSGDQAIDIGAPTPGGSLLGADVLATHQGTVSLVFRNHAIYGNYIIVDGSGDKSGFQTLYAHLQTIAVSRGQKVVGGTNATKLGTVGSTGNSTGPHLHYEFRGLKMGIPYLDSGTISVPACVGRGACNICF